MLGDFSAQAANAFGEVRDGPLLRALDKTAELVADGPGPFGDEFR